VELSAKELDPLDNLLLLYPSAWPVGEGEDWTLSLELQDPTDAQYAISPVEPERPEHSRGYTLIERASR
jgi:hypothetical protein